MHCTFIYYLMIYYNKIYLHKYTASVVSLLDNEQEQFETQQYYDILYYILLFQAIILGTKCN